MKIDNNGLGFLSEGEGLKLKAYKDSGGVWTIGRGVIRYLDGTKVKQGDAITAEQEALLFANTLTKYDVAVDKLVTAKINQTQHNALVSLCYNIGVDAFSKSTLLKMLNVNPNSLHIREQFMRWVKDNGVLVQGLVNRRKKEADLYFKK